MMYVLLINVYHTFIITLKNASWARTGVFGFFSCLAIRLWILRSEFWSLLMTKWRLPAISLISLGKFSENMLSIWTTKPRATKLLMITLRLPTWPMARMRTISVKKGEMIYIEHNKMLTKRPLLPFLAVFVYFRYRSTARACFTSP